MSHFARLDINGYRFALDNGNLLNGVSFEHDSALFGEPDFLYSVEYAAEIYVFWRPYADFAEYHDLQSLKGMNADQLNALADSANQIISTPAFTPEYRKEVESYYSHIWHEIEVRRTRRGPTVRQPVSDTPGYVYLIQSPSGAYKIGYTKNPDDRLHTFSVKLPFEVEYVALIRTDAMRTLEAELHDRYAHKHINGEWFALDDYDVLTIKSLAVLS